MFLNLSLVQNLTLFILLVFTHLGINRVVRIHCKITAKSNLTLLFLVQSILFILLYTGSFEIGRIFYEPQKSSVGWGIPVNLAIWGYISLSFISSLIMNFLPESKRFTILFLFSFIFAYLPISFSFDRPYRVILLLISGFIGLFFPYFLQMKLAKIKESEKFN